ncbi:hypothetical protein, partial [Ralstonia pseudosolanacearum]|uniref:hypothetical protein n=1 Tax=Ralstonia pseudosolanacearum TaxID=1310165 RepID=UPI003CF7686B
MLHDTNDEAANDIDQQDHDACNRVALDKLARETLINGVREWNREPSCSRFPHRGKEVPIEHVFRRFRVVPGALCALRTECFQGWPA